MVGRLYSNFDFAMIFFYYLGFPVLLTIYLGLTLSTCLVIFASWLTKKLLNELILGLTPLTTLDEMFLLDFDKNRANIVTVMKLSKVSDPEQLR